MCGNSICEEIALTRQSALLIHLIAMPHRFAITIRLFVILALVLQVLTPVLPVFAPSSALAAAAAPTPSSVPPAAHDGMPLGALPLATATITPTATIIPTAVAVAAENLNLNLNLDLALDPPWAAPGEVVTFTVTATNLLSTPLPGLVLTATLPDGLVYVAGSAVGFAYAPSTWLQSVSGAATYVGDTFYNALGQVTERRLGSTTGVVRQLYTYPAAENFRLVSQQAGTAAPYTDLQNLSYTDDDTGNVLTISDAAAYGGSQTQSFTYDFLARLQTAQATGGGAPYGDYAQQSYGYSNAGNVTSFEGTAFRLQRRCAPARADECRRDAAVLVRSQRQCDAAHPRRARYHTDLRRREPPDRLERRCHGQLRVRRRWQSGQGDQRRHDDGLHRELLRVDR